MPPKKKAKQAGSIQSDEFEGSENLNQGDWLKLQVDSLNHSADKVVTNWNRGLVGVLGMSLTPDNCKPKNLNVFLQGDLLNGGRKLLLAKRFWPNADNTVHLMLKDLDGALFPFKDNLTSTLVDSSRLSYAFVRGNATLEQGETEEMGLGGFCLKVHLVPTQATWMAFTVSLFPDSLANLTEDHPLCKNPSFPGIRLTSGELPMHPRSSELFPERATGCPLIPAILPGSPIADAPIGITSSDTRAAVAALMRKAIKPDCKNIGPLLAKYQALLENGSSKLADGAPDPIWPLPSEPVSIGKTQSLIKFPLLPWKERGFINGLLPPPPPPFLV